MQKRDSLVNTAAAEDANTHTYGGHWPAAALVISTLCTSRALDLQQLLLLTTTTVIFLSLAQ